MRTNNITIADVVLDTLADISMGVFSVTTNWALLTHIGWETLANIFLWIHIPTCLFFIVLMLAGRIICYRAQNIVARSDWAACVRAFAAAGVENGDSDLCGVTFTKAANHAAL